MKFAPCFFVLVLGRENLSTSIEYASPPPASSFAASYAPSFAASYASPSTSFFAPTSYYHPSFASPFSSATPFQFSSPLSSTAAPSVLQVVVPLYPTKRVYVYDNYDYARNNNNAIFLKNNGISSFFDDINNRIDDYDYEYYYMATHSSSFPPVNKPGSFLHQRYRGNSRNYNNYYARNENNNEESESYFVGDNKNRQKSIRGRRWRNEINRQAKDNVIGALVFAALGGQERPTEERLEERNSSLGTNDGEKTKELTLLLIASLLRENKNNDHKDVRSL